MEFESQYLNYEEYRLLGGELEEMPFNLLEFEARKIIDRRTQGRLIGIDDIPQAVKLCMNKMINTINNYINSSSNNNENNSNNNVASESIDGYSVNYITSNQIQEKMQEIIISKSYELDDIMMNYLSTTIVNGTNILYLGVI